MTQNFIFRKAVLNDLQAIVALLIEDDLGKSREKLSDVLDQRYVDAFGLIDSDHNQFIMVAENGGEIVGICHLTIMPSLTFIGSVRMQIEAVRVSSGLRSAGVGHKMMDEAILYGKSRGASIVQLTTNKQRPRAKQFYEKLGFEPSHEGMKKHI